VLLALGLALAGAALAVELVEPAFVELALVGLLEAAVVALLGAVVAVPLGAAVVALVEPAVEGWEEAAWLVKDWSGLSAFLVSIK
jgi:hypothetical protein